MSVGNWIGQNVFDYLSRFRDDVYLDNITISTESDVVVIDQNGKLSKKPENTTAEKLTVTDSTADTHFPIIFANTSTGGVHKSGAPAIFTYNPNTGTLLVSNLTVSGTTTTLNTANLTVEDNNITLNYHATSDTSSAANLAGITIQDAVSATEDASLTWRTAQDIWVFSHRLQIDNVTGGAGLTINHDDIDQDALQIDAETTTADVINVGAHKVTTGNIINILSEDLTSGNGINMVFSDGAGKESLASVSREFINIDYDKAADLSSGQHGLNSVGLAIDMDISSTSDNGNSSETCTGIKMDLTKANSPNNGTAWGLDVNLNGDWDDAIGLRVISPDGASGDDIRLESSAVNRDYFTINTIANGATTLLTHNLAGANADFTVTADGDISLQAAGKVKIDQAAGSSIIFDDTIVFDGSVISGVTTISTAGIEIESSGSENIILDAGGTIELEGNTNVTGVLAATTIDLHGGGVDGANNQLLTDDGDGSVTSESNLTFDGSILNVTGVVDISPANNAGAAALTVDNDDVDQIALDIDAANTTANVVDIDASAVTSANAIKITRGDSAGGGAVSSATSSTIHIDQDNSSTPGAQEAFNIIHVDYDTDSAVGGAQFTTGVYVDINDTSAASGVANAWRQKHGFYAKISKDNTFSNNFHAGFYADISGGDATYQYGTNPEFYSTSVYKSGNVGFFSKGEAFAFLSTAGDDLDYFGIRTTTNGATKLVTADYAGAAAHLELEADGDIILDAAGDILLEANVGIGTSSPEAQLHLESAGDTALIIRADNDNSGENDNPLIHLQQDFVTSGSSGVLVDSKIGIVGDAGQIFTGSLVNGAYITSQGSSQTAGNDTGKIQFATGGNNGQDTDVAAVLPTARMTIIENGNIGIGVTDPDSKLEIYSNLTPQLKISNNVSDFATFNVGTHGQLTIGTIDGAATSAHIELFADGNIILDAAGDIALEAGGGDITGDALNYTFTCTSTPAKPQMNLINNADDASPPVFRFHSDRAAGEEVTADGDKLGKIVFTGTDSGNMFGEETYAFIQGKALETTAGDEAGYLEFNVANDGNDVIALEMGGVTGTAGRADVNIGGGASSLTKIIGNLEVASNLELGHASDTTIARSAAGKVTIEGNQIVTAGSTGLNSGTQTPIGMMLARRTLTTAEMNALHTTAIELIPAQGVGKVIMPVSAQFWIDRASTNTTYSQFCVGWGTAPAFPNVHFFEKNLWRSQTTDGIIMGRAYNGVFATSLSAGLNQPISAKANAAYTLNAFTSVDVFITYYVLEM